MRYIGVDLHKTTIVACFLSNEKYSFKTYKIEELKKFTSSLNSDDELCFEATANSFWFYRECNNFVRKIIIVNPSQFKVISSSVKKTDKNDSRALAYFLSKDMLPSISLKTLEAQNLQSMLNTRKLLIKQRTMLKNQLHSILLSRGVLIKRTQLCSDNGLRLIQNNSAYENVSIIVSSLVELILSINFQVKKLDKSIELSGSQLPGYENLLTIKGLGSNTVVSLLSIIGNINLFPNHKKLAAFIGLVPIVRNSNQTIKHGFISKRGNPLVRGNLILCAMVAIRKNCYARC